MDQLNTVVPLSFSVVIQNLGYVHVYCESGKANCFHDGKGEWIDRTLALRFLVQQDASCVELRVRC